MTKKVTLPREVAEAIEEARGSFTDGEIISAAIGWDHHGEESLITLREWAKEYRYDTRENHLMSALVNGFEIEKTPEEKVREYYEGLKSREDSEEIAGHSGSQFRQGWQSVEKTLDLLGIQIEGVNA